MKDIYDFDIKEDIELEQLQESKAILINLNSNIGKLEVKNFVSNSICYQIEVNEFKN